MTLSLGTAYRSFGGEVEASSTPMICRLPDSRRHQLSPIALGPLQRSLSQVTRYRLPVTQKRLSNFVFSAALVAVTGFWLWFLLAHADQIFGSIRYLSRGSD